MSLFFFKEFLNQPQHIGAVCPSSKYVAYAVRKMLPAQQTGLVVEIGPGTGAITRELIKYSHKISQLLVVERSKQMAEKLLCSFPHVPLTYGDAFDLPHLLPENQKIMAVVSSMPIVTLEQQSRIDLLKQFRSVIMQGGLYINVSYSFFSNKEAENCGFDRVKHKYVFRNIPPAHIECFKAS